MNTFINSSGKQRDTSRRGLCSKCLKLKVSITIIFSYSDRLPLTIVKVGPVQVLYSLTSFIIIIVAICFCLNYYQSLLKGENVRVRQSVTNVSHKPLLKF